ncbi:MAG TPA: SRPBCC domain-containing protein [Cytophagaceae bacterium]|jgi:uncharacterized protein YndB with AHSA1/START domain|nr:SRPBCC domain-containing protein [Cytophagaceae bacterium]
MKTQTITIERTLHLPLNTVWKAFSEPESLMKWWGPKDYTCPQFTNNFQTGGKYLGAMKNKNGKLTWSTGVYTEIIQNKRIAMTDSFSDSNGNILSGSLVGMPGEWPDELLITLEFQEHEDTTLLLLIHEGLPPERYEDCIHGWQESFDKLENIFKYLRETSNSLEE